MKAAAAAAAAPRALVDLADFDRSSLTVYLKDVLTLVLENRPADPVAFIADYLWRVLGGACQVSRAYQYVTLSPRHRQAFMDNAVVAFSVLDDAGGRRRPSWSDGRRPRQTPAHTVRRLSRGRLCRAAPGVGQAPRRDGRLL